MCTEDIDLQNKMYGDVWIAEQQKVKKQGRGDGIKQFRMQPHLTYLSRKICKGSCTELFYAITPTLFLSLFLLSLCLHTFYTCLPRFVAAYLMINFTLHKVVKKNDGVMQKCCCFV